MALHNKTYITHTPVGTCLTGFQSDLMHFSIEWNLTHSITHTSAC